MAGAGFGVHSTSQGTYSASDAKICPEICCESILCKMQCTTRNYAMGIRGLLLEKPFRIFSVSVYPDTWRLLLLNFIEFEMRFCESCIIWVGSAATLGS